jgi:hypothetical protein
MPLGEVDSRYNMVNLSFAVPEAGTVRQGEHLQSVWANGDARKQPEIRETGCNDIIFASS